MDGEFPITIEQITPMSGVTAGGIGVTIFGSGFQKDALVYFGSQLAEKTVVESSSIIETTVPASAESGTVAVTVVNPDNSQGVQNVGFVYISPENPDRAEVIGISPLTVIEETETEIVLHGRNLIEAYENGLVALRCPARLNLEISKVTIGGPDESGVETLIYNLIVTATPALEPLERIAIQVLASRRPESKDDLIVESSKQMFVVLPRDVPVPVAQTPSLSLDKPTMVVVLGRNLDGCTLEFAEGIKPHVQRSDEDSLYGLVTISKEYTGEAQTTFSILDKQGNLIGNYNLSVAPSAELKQSNPIPSYSEPGPAVGYTTDLIEVPNQQFAGPTPEDAKVFDLKGELQNNLSFNTLNVGTITFRYRYRFLLFNRVYLFGLFDGGGDVIGSEVLAEVGKLFPLRGSGILYAARVQVTITIIIIVIITIDFPWHYGGFNEFPEDFPNAIGIIISGWDIDFEIILEIGVLNALVLPDGRLRILFYFGLTIGIHFSISPDGLHLKFVRDFTHFVRYFNILPFAEQFPCSGRFQLADDNGQTVFIDQYGGRRSFYFPRLAGECCVPWSFNLELARFIGTGTPETVQPPFNASYCLNAAPPSNGLRRPYVWSDPEPTDTPPTLKMNLGSSAELVVLAQPVDEDGNPTGSEVDIKTLEHDVRFYLADSLEVLDPDTLPDGHAQSIEEGDNIVKAAVSSVRILDDKTEVPALFSFYPGSIVGFNILRFLALGESPRVVPQGLPVSVTINVPAADYTIEPKLAYEKQVGSQIELVEVNKIERLEPHETPRKYVLAAKVTAPIRNSNVTITFPTITFAMKLRTGDKPLELPDPLFQFPEGRGNINDPKKFFSGNLVNQTQLTLNVSQTADLSKLIAFNNGDLFPNLFEETAAGSPTNFTKVVPPGPNVQRGSETKLSVKLSNNPTTNTSATVSVTRTDFDFGVQNEETYEEYFRVFHQIRALLHRTSPTPPARLVTLASFASNFHTDLINNDLANLITKGQDLWKTGYEYVQMDEKDDRPLYYARLEALVVLRTYYKRKYSASVPPGVLNKFEWSSRGFEITAANNPVIQFATTTDRKVIVTGYDPFLLYDEPLRSNTSGIAALGLNKDAFSNTVVRSVLMPVRFRDFNAGFIEQIMEEAVKDASIIMTSSWTGRYYLNIDRFATSYRTTSLIDNENEKGGTNFPTGATPHYLETTLPYECPDVFSNNQLLDGGEFLVLDQSFYQYGAGGRNAPPPIHGTPESYEKSSTVPTPNLTVEEGSGGNYLSNEIFFRTTKVRRDKQPGLPSGHLHIRALEISSSNYPTLPPNVQRTRSGAQILLSVKDILARFLNALKRLVFSDTKVGSQNSATITLSNTGSTPIQITSGNFVSGSTVFQLTTTLPVTIAAGANAAFQFKFLPVDAKRFIDTAHLKDTAGKVLFCVQLEGRGIDSLVSIPTTVNFPDTVINRESSIVTRVKNVTATQTIIINSADINSPFSRETVLPVTIAPGTEKTLTLKFKPTTLGDFTGEIGLKDAGNNVLLRIGLSGKGIAQPPAPTITSFSPTSGYAGDEITVTGTNFIDVQEVKMRDILITNDPPLNPNQMKIYAGNLGGKIKIKTAYGEVESATVFFVRPIRIPPED